ncbi:hypothetical protein GCM10010486_00760 [Nonomuraea roseoviolacea subsp. carminata]
MPRAVDGADGGEPPEQPVTVMATTRSMTVAAANVRSVALAGPVCVITLLRLAFSGRVGRPAQLVSMNRWARVLPRVTAWLWLSIVETLVPVPVNTM